tara:strand:+ start:2667 stop:4889 length:2223 start_codon:yes stop_codon:yes gene_type:complete
MKIELSRYKTNSIQGQRRSNTYYPNASDNLFSNYLNSLYNNSPTHQCIIDDITQQVIGLGLTCEDPQKDAKLKEFFKKKDLFAMVSSLIIQESITLEVKRNPLLDIQSVSPINVSHFRVTDIDNGEPCRFSYREDWNPQSSVYNYKNTYINSYNSEETNSLLYYYDSGTFNTPYGRPKYIAAADAIELEIAIYMMHNHGAQNGMFPSMVISKETSGDPETDRRDSQETQAQVMGAANAGKVVSTYYRQGGNAPTFSAPSLSGLDKIYDSQYETAEIGILKGHRIPSANLISGLNSKGAGFTSETEELAYATARMREKIVMPRRELLLDILAPIFAELEIQGVYFKDAVEAPLVAPEGGELAGVNESVKNLTGRQMQGIERIVRKYSKDQLTENQAKLMLTTGYGFSDEEAMIWLQTEDVDAIDGEVTEELSNVELSYNDYPESASNNAQTALDWAEKNGWGSCGEATGKNRANQLAKGENISRDTISRMASFERHRKNSKKKLGDGCGRLMWLAWGGDSGIAWAQRKLKQIDKEKLKKKDFDDEAVLDALEGEKVDLDKWELVDVREAKNEDIESWASDFIKTSKSNLEKLADVISSKPNGFSVLDKSFYKVRYSYQEKYSSGNSRKFCSGMMARTGSGVVYRLEDIDQATRAGVNKSFGHKGEAYDLFKYKGGVSCGHVWQEELYRLKDKTEKGSKYISKYQETNTIPSSYKPRPTGNKESKIAPKDMPNQGHHPNYNK